MPRSYVPIQPELPYHLSARSINRDWFRIPMDDVWAVMSEQLHFLRHAFDFRVHAFVLMSNHYHLIGRVPQGNLSEAMRWFMLETSRNLLRAGNRINQSYGGRYFRSLLRTHHYYLHAYKYVYSNPIRAGICRSAEEYPYSTLRGLLGLDHCLVPVESDDTLFSDTEGTLRWINQDAPAEDWQSVRNALRKPEFRLRLTDKKRNHLEDNAL